MDDISVVSFVRKGFFGAIICLNKKKKKKNRNPRAHALQRHTPSNGMKMNGKAMVTLAVTLTGERRESLEGEKWISNTLN